MKTFFDIIIKEKRNFRKFEILSTELINLYEDLGDTLNLREKRAIRKKIFVKKRQYHRKLNEIWRFVEEIVALRDEFENAVPKVYKKLTIGDIISEVLSQPDGEETISGADWEMLIRRKS